METHYKNSDGADSGFVCAPWAPHWPTLWKMGHESQFLTRCCDRGSLPTLRAMKRIETGGSDEGEGSKELYGGSLALDRSPLGGLRASLDLPASLPADSEPIREQRGRRVRSAG